MIMDFARLFLDVIGQPRDINDLRAAFDLVTICWNLPVFDREDPVEAARHRRQFDAVVATYPEPLSSALLGLIDSRELAFDSIPFLVLVEVRGTSLEDCTIYAEARCSGGGQPLKDPS